MAKVLFHVDLNAFFASAEELRHPELKGKPLAVGSLSSRGVLSTCNYEARKFGLHSGMPTMQARSMCPELVILPGDYEYYRKLSGQFFDVLRQFTGRLEILSIDECYLDVTEPIRQFKRPLDLAVAIQRQVFDQLGLKCSIGVGPTRFLAKMASDMYKPMGITVVRKSDIPSKIYPLPVDACLGIGKKTVPLLLEKDIRTIGDLMDPDNEQALIQILGNMWLPLKMKLTGRSSDELNFSTTRKSISHSRTFSHDLYALDEILENCRILCKEISQNMIRHHRMGSQISIVLRDTEFKNSVRSAKLPYMTNAFEVIYEAASNLFTQYYEPIGYRHIGISIGSLKDEDQIIEQPSLFDHIEKSSDSVIQSLNHQFDSQVFMKASDLLKAKDGNHEQ